MYKHILVAVGLNPDLTTLKSAIEIALESGARVTALHVVNPAAHLPGLADRTFCATLRTFEALGRTVVDRSRRALDEAQCPGDAQMRMLPFGDVTVGQVIADAADELGADLVVVGSNDPGWFLLYLQNMQKDVVRRCRTRVLVMTPACLPKARHATDAVVARRQSAQPRAARKVNANATS
ncbi:universal stress protein [Paraburkholderia panacisoli]|jgi:nucleotide-binding universal stress UspA family protein|uniref:Universal stress protein n=1 Tax=Paraburkholderia panacisoli TaxID=2603818 RepID=A0A5B0G4Z2_9BURK|nr:universal stress protein [Paraburkholderia panacisoli]KAA0998282.1 universal stress protein [Paraburkholderia panacisoli]